MADNKPECVNTCTADECTPMFEGGPHWFDPHMPCWICHRDDHTKRHDLMWHDESAMYFHKLCLLERARQQAMDKIKDAEDIDPCVPLILYVRLNAAGRLLRTHRERLTLRGE